MPDADFDLYDDALDSWDGSGFDSWDGGGAFSAAPQGVRAAYEMPNFIAEINFDGVTWTNVTSYLYRWDVRRGRSKERDRMGVGQATLVLDNHLGTFDRDNPASPFYPNVRPNRKVRLRARMTSQIGLFVMGRSAIGNGAALLAGSLDLPIFVGRTEGGPLEYAARAADSSVAWNVVDDSKRLNRDRAVTGFGVGNVLTGMRVNQVLDGSTPVWPIAERNIDLGTRTVQPETGEAGRYDYLLQVADSEGGAFFMGSNGDATFRDATHLFSTGPLVFGDRGGEHPYRDIQFVDDDAQIFNAVTVSANGQTDVVAEDGISQVEFGRSDLAVGTLMANPVDMLALATGLLGAYSQPSSKITQITLGNTQYMNWRFVLSRELLDHVRVRMRTQYGVTYDEETAIQGISIVSPNSRDWTITWSLSRPANLGVGIPNLLNANQFSVETDASGWELRTGGGFGGTFSQSATYSYVGSKSLSILLGSPGIGGVLSAPYNVASAFPGRTYKATAYGLAGVLSIFSINLQWTNGAGTVLSTTSGTPVWVQGFVWQKIEYQAVAPPNTVYCRVSLVVQEAYTTQEHWWDAISLVEV